MLHAEWESRWEPTIEFVTMKAASSLIHPRTSMKNLMVEMNRLTYIIHVTVEELEGKLIVENDEAIHS